MLSLSACNKNQYKNNVVARRIIQNIHIHNNHRSSNSLRCTSSGFHSTRTVTSSSNISSSSSHSNRWKTFSYMRQQYCLSSMAITDDNNNNNNNNMYVSVANGNNNSKRIKSRYLSPTSLSLVSLSQRRQFSSSGSGGGGYVPPGRMPRPPRVSNGGGNNAGDTDGTKNTAITTAPTTTTKVDEGWKDHPMIRKIDPKYMDGTDFDTFFDDMNNIEMEEDSFTDENSTEIPPQSQSPPNYQKFTIPDTHEDDENSIFGPSIPFDEILKNPDNFTEAYLDEARLYCDTYLNNLKTLNKKLSNMEDDTIVSGLPSSLLDQLLKNDNGSSSIKDDDDTIIKNINNIIGLDNHLTTEDDDDEELDPLDLELQALKQIIARADDKDDTKSAYWDEEERDFANIDTDRLSFEDLMAYGEDDTNSNNNQNKQLQLQQGGGQQSNNKTDNNNDGADETFIPPRYDTITPLSEYHGPGRDDLIKAMHYHPTKFASYGRKDFHPDSRREPVPDFPKNRTNPPLSFVESNIRFIFVTGLPPPIQQQQEQEQEQEQEKAGTETEAGENNQKSNNVDPGMNKLRFHDMQATISDFFNVPSSQVFPANENSAFIGFDNPQEFTARFEAGPKKSSIIRPVSISEYSSNNENNNVIGQVHVDHIPKGFTASSLKNKLFPQNSTLQTEFGNAISVENINIQSQTSALITFPSKEMAQSFVSSSKENKIGVYKIRYFKARRELITMNKFAGPNNWAEGRELGPKLIVDSLDMPTKEFYTTHAQCICLRGVHSSGTNSTKQLTELFQQFCTEPRLLDSIEYVTDANGKRAMNKAYIGFDRFGDANKVQDHYKDGRIPLPDGSIATIKYLKDRVGYGQRTKKGNPVVEGRRRQQRNEKTDEIRRSERSEDEILDNLNNWEQYVENKEDIKYLTDNGISYDTLNDTFRGLRHYNKSFGTLDTAISSERIDPNKTSNEEYGELVRDYITTLKQCVVTPENPGFLFKGLHTPDEELDMGIFEEEKERMKQLQEKRDTAAGGGASGGKKKKKKKQ